MTAPVKPHSLQAYQLFLYNRALHPELFQLKGRKTLKNDAYELEVWVMPGSHLVRFERKALCACELVTSQEGSLPETGIITGYLCAGERDFEHNFEKDGVTYINTFQTETLSENLYLATYAEMLDHARATAAVFHEWEDEAGRCLSILEVERHHREAHVQAFHLLAQGGFVLRTQTIFEHT